MLERKTTLCVCIFKYFQVVIVQLLGCIQLFATPWTAVCQGPLSFNISWRLLKFISIELVMLSHHLILCCPLPLSTSLCSPFLVTCLSLPLRCELQDTHVSINWDVKVTVVSDFCNCMDYIIHGILQARLLEWVAFPLSRGSSKPRDRTPVSGIPGRFFTS